MNEWISITAAADVLSIARPTVYRLIERGELSWRRRGSRGTEVLRSEVEARLLPQRVAS